MSKTKRISTQMPRGLLVKNIQEHVDSVNLTLAEEHYKKYIIVKNENNTTYSHNRLYLCHKSYLEFAETFINKLPKRHINVVSLHYIYTLFPHKEKLSQHIISSLIKHGESRQQVKKFLIGLSLFYVILEEVNIIFNDIRDFAISDIKIIERHVKKKGTYSQHQLRSLTKLLRSIIVFNNEKYEISILSVYGVKTKKNNSIVPTLAITWQIDVFAEKAIEKLILRVEKYRKWMIKLEEIGELFSLRNLAYTFFENIDILGKASGPANKTIRKIALNLYNIEFQCWKNYSYINKKEKEQELKIRKLGKGGINILPKDEYMFALWHKVIAPEYPYDKRISSKYSFLFLNNSLESWRANLSLRVNFSRRAFDAMIYPSFDEIYPLYLLVLCRTGLNSSVIQDWRICINEKGKYSIGVDTGMGRLIDGYKGRGNTKQTAVLDKLLCRYIDFYIEWMSPLYEKSKDNHFFQFKSSRFKGLDNSHSRINSKVIGKHKERKKNTFYHLYPIMNEIKLPTGQLIEERILWLDHSKIRKVKNLSEYLNNRDQYSRKMNLGHKNQKTEYIYQQSVEFADTKGHQIATVQNQLITALRGDNQTETSTRLKKIFSTPISNCKDPYSPSYIGVKNLRKNSVCTNWRKCLTECSQSEVIDIVHGPVIKAWIDCMDDIRKEYSNIELWENEFSYDYKAAESTFKNFSPDVIKICEENSSKFSSFVRAHVLNSRHSKRVNKEGIECD